jgi:chromosomal replication initiation ATPase DnaA
LNHFNISVDEIVGHSRMQHIMGPRHIAAFLIRNNTNLTFEEIGKVLNKPDHLSARNSCSKVEKEILINKVYSDAVEKITRQINIHGNYK